MKKHIIFTGGGTGGHVYPALAIIEHLIKNGYNISWIGSKKGIEYKIINNYGIKFYSIPCGKLRRYFSLLNFIDIFKIFIGFIKSFFLLLYLKPDLIFSKGGYVTVPPIIAGKLLKIKSITHESDFSPGLATRINSKFVSKILVPYQETKEYFSADLKQKVVVTGNPVRSEFFKADQQVGLEYMGFKNNKPIILVLGGSLGAKEINDLIEESIEKLTLVYNVYHQMGEKNFIEIDTESYKTTAFINNNMADIIKASSLVISRSGAGAIWEFISVGTPSLLIPLTVGSRGDQILNANYFVEKGVSLILQNENVKCDILIDTLENYFNKLKIDMEETVKEFGKVDFAQKICKEIEELI